MTETDTAPALLELMAELGRQTVNRPFPAVPVLERSREPRERRQRDLPVRARLCRSNTWAEPSGSTGG